MSRTAARADTILPVEPVRAVGTMDRGVAPARSSVFGSDILVPSLAEPLDDHGHALAAADAHRLQADGHVPLDQSVEQGVGDARAGHAEGVPHGDRAAVDV